MTIQIIEPEARYLNKPNTEYEDVHEYKKFCKKLILDNGTIRAGRRNHFMFMGPPGTGKSLLAETLIYEVQQELGVKIPYFVLEASEDTREHHLKGTYVMAGDVTPFVLGVIAAAVSKANATGIAALNVEEISAMSPGTQKILNGLLDQRRSVSIPEAGLHLKLDEHAHLIFISSLNPEVYGGVNALNGDLVSRLNIRLHFGFPQAQAEINLLSNITKVKDKGLILSLVRIAQLSRISSMNYQITTRDLRETIEIIKDTGDHTNALRSLINPFRGSEDDYLKMVDRVQAVFDGVVIKETKVQYEDKVQAYRV